MNCSLGCMKCLVFVFNVVYAVVGVALLSTAINFFTQELETGLDEEANALAMETNDAMKVLKMGALFFLVKGILGILLAVLGCWGTIKESQLLLKVLAGVLVLLAVFQIILSGMSFAYSANDGMLGEARRKITDNVYRYGTESKYKYVQEHLEEKYHCCGGSGFEDYYNVTGVEIPKSCCLVNTDSCDTHRDASLKHKGCGDAVAEKIAFLYKTVGAISTVLYILEIIGAIGSYFLAVTVLNAKRRGTFT